jgi:hypothetical protein
MLDFLKWGLMTWISVTYMFLHWNPNPYVPFLYCLLIGWFFSLLRYILSRFSKWLGTKSPNHV